MADDQYPLTVASATFHEGTDGHLLVEIADRLSSDDEEASSVWFSLDEVQARELLRSLAMAVEQLWGKSH